MNKRGDIPVLMLVVLVLALYVIALFAFIWIGSRDRTSVSEGYKEIKKAEFEIKNKEFLGESGSVNKIVEKRGEVQFRVDWPV